MQITIPKCQGRETLMQMEGCCKPFLPAEASANISVSRRGCSTHLSAALLAEGEERGSLTLQLACAPGLSLQASVQHSVVAMGTLGFPTRGKLVLNVSTAHLPAAEVDLELGRCSFSGRLGKAESSGRDEERRSYLVNVTNFCPALQGTVLPESLALTILTSVIPGHLTVTSSLRTDGQDLLLDLRQSSRPRHVSGSLTHSFPGLRRAGVPQVITMEATAPRGQEQPGLLFVRAGTCFIRASHFIETRGGEWLWALDSRCPTLQAQVNGSVVRDPPGVWMATVDAELQGTRGLLRLKATPWPELSFEGELTHNLPAPTVVPQRNRLRVSSRAGQQRHDSEALLELDGCSVRASGAVVSQGGLQGSLVYHNNCSLIQGLGSPERLHSSGSLVVSPTLAQSQLSVVVDDKYLHTYAAFRSAKDKYEASMNLNHTAPLLKGVGLPATTALTLSSASRADGSRSYSVNGSAGSQKLSQEVTVARVSDTARVQSHFKHTLSFLRKLGLPANISAQVEIGSLEGRALSLELQFGDQAGVSLRVKCLPVSKEVRGAVWHSWSWLQNAGMPKEMEGQCSIRGVFPQLQSGAQLSVDGRRLLSSGFNVSVADGRLALLLSLSPPAPNDTATHLGLNASLSAQFKGPLRSVSADIHCPDWRIQAMGDVGGWAAYEGSKEARVTLRHTRQGQPRPALQVEAWGSLTKSQLRCSVAVNPELSSSLALILQGHHLPHSKDLILKVVNNIPTMLVYLPSQLSVSSQLNQSRSGVSGLAEVSSGRRRLWAQGEVAATESGYRQAVELKHSFPQLKPLPKTVAVRSMFEARDWSYELQHGSMWGSQEISLSGVYSAPPTLKMGNKTLKVQISCLPRRTSVDVTMERSSHGRLDSVSLGWTRHGRLEQVKAVSSWSRSEELNETKVELRQPFTSTLSQISLHTLSQSSQRQQSSSQQVALSLSSTSPVNVSLNLNKQWHNDSSRGQACVLFSAKQMSVSSVKGCVSVGQEDNSYSQNAELRWDNKSVKQGIKYQRDLRGIHSFQVSVGLERVSPEPCSSHSLLAKVQTNLRDHLEHTLLLGLCPPKPALTWSGLHRVNAGEELFYTQSRLAVAGQPQLCGLTFALINSSAATQGSNVSLFSESKMGNWSLEVSGSALSWPRGSGLLMQVRLDRREKMWLNGTMEGRCLRSTTGYADGSEVDEDVTVVACVGKNRSLTLDLQKRVAAAGGGGSKSTTLGSLSVESTNQKLSLTARGCLDSLQELEEEIQYLGSHIQTKLLERIRTLQRLISEFRRQSRDSEWLQELSAAALDASQQAEALLGRGGGAMLAPWRDSLPRRFVADSLPRLLHLLQQASLLGQQELRRPLATLAGVYQDVRGQRPEAVWKEAVALWMEWLEAVVPALLGNTQLRPLAQVGLSAVGIAVDVAGQHTYQWLETRLATSLSGLRKKLASAYTFSPSQCSVSASLPLPPLPWSRVAEAGLVEVLMEEWLLRPLQTLATIRPMAELYRLKRNIMDSPFRYQALLVSDQFAVTFDGHLHELPGSCPLLLAQDIGADPSFTLLLNPDSRSLLKLWLNNSTIDVQTDGQVKANCSSTVTHTLHGHGGVSVRIRARTLQVSNQNGVALSCDLSRALCSFTLDGLLHGASVGVLGTNDNEAGNDLPLPDGSQAQNLDSFLNGWQVAPKKGDGAKLSALRRPLQKAAASAPSCDSLFSSPDSTLSPCFRVVDPAQFWSVCAASSSAASCRLAHAFIYLCQQNYIPLEVPAKCLKL